MTVFTTLNKIRSESPCTEGWSKLLAYLGKTKADDEPISLVTILESNGLFDAIWCLRALDGYEREIRLFAVACARQVQHLMTDKRSIDALDVAERFANGDATRKEFSKALDAAFYAARATPYASRTATNAAYYAANASYAAADATNAANASYAAADAADAARYAITAARAAYYAADAADASSYAAARTKQAELFREFFG